MKTNFIMKLFLLAAISLSLHSCIREDMLSATEQEKEKQAGLIAKREAWKSPWQEDEVYIGKVKQVYTQYSNESYIQNRYGEIFWEYAMTMNTFDEKYLIVPVLKDNKVVNVLQVFRKDQEIFFKFSDKDAEANDFFENLIFADRDKIIVKQTEKSNKTSTLQCRDYILIVGYVEGTNEEQIPIEGVKTICKWVEQDDYLTDCLGVIDTITGECISGGVGGSDGSSTGSGYPYPSQNEPVSACDKLKAQKSDPDFNAKMNVLESDTGLEKETGYIQRTNGQYTYKDNASATPTNNSLNLPNPDLPENKDIKGYIHTHVDDFTYYDSTEQADATRKGIKMFSPADLAYFMKMIRNAKDAGRTFNEVYAGMVTSSGKYQLRFTGNQNQIKTFTDAETIAFRISYTEFMKKNIGNPKKLEVGFLQFIKDKMNVRGVTLYRMNENGTNTEINLNTAGTDTVETNCPI